MSPSRFHLAGAIALAVIVASCTAKPEPPPAAPDPAMVRAAIETAEKEWSAAYMTGDASKVALLYSEDAASVPPAGDWARGREAIAKQIQANMDSVNLKTREDITEEVMVMGDHAVEVGHYSWTGTSKKGGAMRGESGRYMVLWRKDADGTWRLVRDIGSMAPATVMKKM